MKRIVSLFLTILLLAGCSPQPRRQEQEDASKVHILCTTYPMYLFTTALTDGVEELEVSLLVNAQTSCLHDYTLTVKDMKAIEHADVIIMNGAGLETFMESALAASHAPVIDCSAPLQLLPALEQEEHGGHGHDDEADPHYWMSPHLAAQVVQYIAGELSALDEAHKDIYAERLEPILQAIAAIDPFYWDAVCPSYPLITFHDGFQYLANAFGLELLMAIEEEEGATASAMELKEVIALVQEREIPAIFVERNGSSASARAIAQETGCQVLELDMLMSGNGRGIEPYLDAITSNVTTIMEAFQ